MHETREDAEDNKKRALPSYFEEERHAPHKKIHNETCTSDELSIDPDLYTSPVAVSQPFPSQEKTVIFDFKNNVHAEHIRLSKDLEQCDQVQKFFAYARLARISDNKHVMLEAHLSEDNSVFVVRDDDGTFKELLDAIEQKQNEEDQDVHITITPADY